MLEKIEGKKREEPPAGVWIKLQFKILKVQVRTWRYIIMKKSIKVWQLLRVYDDLIVHNQYSL